MQSKSSGPQQEKKKSVCLHYMKGMCLYGKSCRYQHPPRENSELSTNSKKSARKSEVCLYYLQNKCKRGQDCPYLHITPKSTNVDQQSDWLTFCPYYPSGQCRSKECRFLHVTDNDEATFCATGEISSILVEQAMCKALLQDVSFNGNASVCKKLLQGYCDRVSCPCLHISRQAYTEAILRSLITKFESVFGPQEASHLPSARMYRQPGSILYESPGFNALPVYGSSGKYQTHNLQRRNYVGDPCKPSYESSCTWNGTRSKFDKQKYIDPESNQILKEMYSLMKDDVNLIRNADKQEIYDLREKLNSLADENTRYLYRVSKRQPHEENHYRSDVRHISKEEIKYQDMIRTLEKENLEMKRRLAELEEQKSSTSCMGKPGSLVVRETVEKDQWQEVDVGELGHYCDTIRDADNEGHASNPGGEGVPMAHRLSFCSPVRHKIQSHLHKNAIHQYNQPRKHQYHGTGQYNKTTCQTHVKSQHRNQEVQQNKLHRGSQNQQKKQGKFKTSNQMKSTKPKIPKSMSENANATRTCVLKKLDKENTHELEAEDECLTQENLHEKQSENGCSQDYKTKKWENTRLDEKSVTHKKKPKSKSNEENSEEVERKDETLEEYISERGVNIENSQNDEAQRDKNTTEDEKSVTPKGILKSILDKEESGPNPDTVEVIIVSSQNDEAQKDKNTTEDEKSVTPKGVFKSKLDKDESGPNIDTVEKSVDENLSGKVVVYESSQEDETEVNKYTKEEENFVQGSEAIEVSENMDPDPGNEIDEEKNVTKQIVVQDVVNQ